MVFVDLSLATKILIHETIFTSLIMAIGLESAKIKLRKFSKMSFHENFTLQIFLAIRYNYNTTIVWTVASQLDTLSESMSSRFTIMTQFMIPTSLSCDKNVAQDSRPSFLFSGRSVNETNTSIVIEWNYHHLQL